MDAGQKVLKLLGLPKSVKCRAQEAYKLKHLTVYHSENSQALNVKDQFPTTAI
jgi:hypothetical protein